MNYFPSVNVETRVHISSANIAGQGGITAGICSANLAAVSAVNAKLKVMEIQALEQEKAQLIRRFILTFLATFIFVFVCLYQA